MPGKFLLTYITRDQEKDAEIEANDMYFPLWQSGPAPKNASVINFDLHQNPEFRDKFYDAIEERKNLISGVADIAYLLKRITPNYNGTGPQSVLFEPVYDDFTADANVTGFVLASLPWEYVLGDILPSGKCDNASTVLSANELLNLYVGRDPRNLCAC